MQAIQYILMTSVCLSFFYMAYRLIYKRETNFRQLRFYLLGSILLSLLFPFSSYTINTGFYIYNSAPDNAIAAEASLANNPSGLEQSYGKSAVTGKDPDMYSIVSKIDWPALAIRLYLMVTLVLLIRIAIQLIVLTYQYIKSVKIKFGDCLLLYNHRFMNTFSFFKWIFVHQGISTNEEIEQIITHEKIHVSQYHSFDLIVIELLAAVMWFNPLIWMMKNSMQLVHEYLADEGTLGTGIDRFRYQALLINQTTEERLICLSSSFNSVCRPGRHSLIKKRMIMMTKNKINRKTKLKLLTLIPISASLFFVVAILNGLLAENVRAVDPGRALTRIGFEGSAGPNSGYSAIALDTIKKKTITKIINKENPQDTVITETMIIEVTDDADKKIKVIVNSKPDSVKIKSKTVSIVINKQVNNLETLDTDSVTTIEVIKQDDGGERIITKNTVEIRQSTGKESSKILYIVDGVPCLEKDPLSKLDPDQIISIEVVKGAESKEFTDKDYDGVIVIKTKAAKE